MELPNNLRPLPPLTDTKYKYDPQNVTEDYFLPQRAEGLNGQSLEEAPEMDEERLKRLMAAAKARLEKLEL